MEEKDPWKDKLDPETYRVTRQGGTERPFTGKFYKHSEKGNYHCVCCDALLFKSDVKFDSGCGWPSFFDGEHHNIKKLRDDSHGMIRTEIRCAKCDSHLGHVFDDGPQPTGVRFCVNSVSLNFEKE